MSKKQANYSSLPNRLGKGAFNLQQAQSATQTKAHRPGEGDALKDFLGQAKSPKT
jgi:hypothetical protein